LAGHMLSHRLAKTRGSHSLSLSPLGSAKPACEYQSPFAARRNVRCMIEAATASPASFEGGVADSVRCGDCLRLCDFTWRRLLLCIWLITSVATAQTLIHSELVHSATGDEEVLVVQEGLNQVTVLRQDAVGARTVIKVGEKPHEVSISKDGLTAYVSNFGLLEANHKVGTPGSTISVIDVAQKREMTRFKLPPGAGGPHGLKIRPAH
jgi:hypothetical protein